MALIECPECKRVVSDRALSCPNCGYPINSNMGNASQSEKSEEIEKYLDLALKGIQGQNSEQVEKYCQAVLEIDPKNSKAWEYEARGILFDTTLRKNNIMQAIMAAANAINYTDDNKEELALNLYDSIGQHINGLMIIATTKMPLISAPPYVVQCMNYYGELLSGIPHLPKSKIEAELEGFKQMENDSKKAIMPKKRLIFASHMGKPAWDEQFRSLLRAKGIL